MYIAFIVIVALFWILRGVDKKNAEKQDKEIADCRTASLASAYTCKVENDQLRGQIVELITGFNEMKGEMKTLKKLGIIKE